MYQLDNILEQWAAAYRPLSHPLSLAAKPKDKRFFRIDGLEFESEWHRNQNLITTSPDPRYHPACMLWITAIDAAADNRNPDLTVYQHRGYLAVRQQSLNNAANDTEADDCRRQLNEMVIALRAFLRTMRDAASGKSFKPTTPESVRQIFYALPDDERKLLRTLRLENFEFWSTPRTLQGWWLLGIEFDSLDPNQICINPEDYL